MQIVIYCLIVCLFTIDWLADKVGLLPRIATFYPELFAVILMSFVIANYARYRQMFIDNQTGIILCFLVMTLLGSALVNTVSPGVFVGGVRNHLKFLPFFLLPMVIRFSEVQIQRQLTFLVSISLLQLPVALYQRFHDRATIHSSDTIGGTIGAHSSGRLSVWLACVICIVFSQYLLRELPRKYAVPLIVLLFMPMTLNSTKITFFLVPIVFLVPALIFFKSEKRLYKLVAPILVVMFGLVAEATLYDYFYPKERSIASWLVSDDAVKYLHGGTEIGGGTQKDVKRFDAIRLAYSNIRHENVTLLGFGIGNVSPAFSREFEGEQYGRYAHFLPRRTQLSYTMWETGVVGTGFLILLIANCGLVAMKMHEHAAGIYRSLALGWTGVSIIMLLCQVYLPIFTLNLFTCLFWFYSGVVVSEYARIVHR